MLRQLLDIQAQQRAEAERFHAEFEAEMAEMTAKREAAMRERLIERGVPEEAARGTEEGWEKRMEETRRESARRIEAARQKDAEYKEQLLAELRTQSDLLRQIAERLGR